MKIKFAICFIVTVILRLNESKFTVKRIDLLNCDNATLSGCKASVVRYGRHSDYNINIEGTLLRDINDSFMAHFIYDEYLNNQYRPSFVQAHGLMCKLFNHEPYFGGAMRAGFAKVGITSCPFKPMHYKVHNMTIPSGVMKFVWPFQKARINFKVEDRVKKIDVISAYAYVELTDGIKEVKKNNNKKEKPDADRYL